MRTGFVREDVLDPTEVLPLFKSLQDRSVDVRVSAFEALTRLPLSPVDWFRVAEFVGQVLDAGQSAAERLAVIRASPWIPVRSVRERISTIGDESERKDVTKAVQTLASDRKGWQWPEGAAEASPLHPTWAPTGDPPGFTLQITSQLSDEQTWLSVPAASDTHARVSSEEVILSLVNKGLIEQAAAAVTALFQAKFEDGGIFNWDIGNDIVRTVATVQGRIRPDLEGLFYLYRRAAAEFLGAWGDLPAFFEDWENSLRATCWQLAWIVSRGGLRSLVPGLAGHLASDDREERVAAALLIADAADYVLQPFPPTFGGGNAPGRGPTSEVLLDDASYRLPQRSMHNESREGDWVECSAFAPRVVFAPSSFLVQAFAHIPDQARDEALRLARQFDPRTDWRGVKTLDCKLSRGTHLVFDLAMPGLKVDDPEQRLVWSGRTESVQFGVSVPRGHRPGTVVGILKVSQGWVPIGHIKFTVEVTRASIVELRRLSKPVSAVGEYAKRYESAFASYASADRTKMLEMVQVLPLFGIRVFRDVLDLKPGERWERSLYKCIDESDIVLLFWSTAAKRSKWVRREIGYALKRQRVNEFALPAIRPVIIEGPPAPRPWKEVANLHFNDPSIYFMAH